MCCGVGGFAPPPSRRRRQEWLVHTNHQAAPRGQGKLGVRTGGAHVPIRAEIMPDLPSLAASPCLVSPGYAAHTLLDNLFPWRFARHDAVLAPFLANLTTAQKAAASKLGQAPGIYYTKVA